MSSKVCPDFQSAFLEEKTKEEARIEDYLQRALEAELLAKESKRQAEAAAAVAAEDSDQGKRCCFRTSRKPKKSRSRAALLEKQRQVYQKSHPAWRMNDVLADPIAGVVLSNLRAALAPECDERMEIAFVRALAKVSPESLARALESKDTLLSVAKVIQATAQRASSTGAMAGADLNDKFCTSDSKSYKMAFGTTEDFQAGLEARIGSPNPNILPSIFQEHCARCDSDREWTTGNYGISTKPKKEFYLVSMEVIRQCQSEEGKNYPNKWHRAAKFLQANFGAPSELPDVWPAETKNVHLGRRPQDQKFLKELFLINEELRKIRERELAIEEGMMLRLYTGPLFEKYNAVPRGFSLNGKANEHLEREFRRLCCSADGEENRYCSSIHVLNSGVLKLSQLTKLEPGAAVFRGVGSGILPRAFWEEDHRGCKGGAELGFMSTTRDEGTATRYAGDGDIKMVMKFETGAIDRGAEMERLSQYPHEKEILFPPLAFLQVLDIHAEGGVLIVHTRVNVNLRSPTIEEVIAKRYQILKLMSESNTMEVRELVRASSWKRLLPEEFLQHSGLLQKAFTNVVQAEVDSILNSEAIHYNEDYAFLTAVQQLVQAANEVRLQKSSLLRRAASVLPNSARLSAIADEREAMEVMKQSCSFNFLADFAGMGQLWLFRVLGLQKAQDGMYYPMSSREQDYRSFLLAKKPIASKGVELPQGLALLSANGRRDLEAWAQEVQQSWRTGLEISLDLVFCAPRCSEDFSKALLSRVEQGESASSLARYLLSNCSQQELDLDSAGLLDEEGQRLAQALVQTSGRLDLELLILSHNDLRSGFATGLSEAMGRGCLPRLELLQLFDNTELGGDLEAMRKLLAAAAEHCWALEVLNLEKIGLKETQPEAFASQFSPIFATLLQRLRVLQLTRNDLGPGLASLLAQGCRAAAAELVRARDRAGSSASASASSDLVVGRRATMSSRRATMTVSKKGIGTSLPLQRLWLHRNPRLFEGHPEACRELLTALAGSCAGSLEELRLEETGLAGAPCSAALAAALPSLRKLRKLALSDNPSLLVGGADGPSSRALLESLEGCPAMEELWLNNSGLCDCIDALPKLPKLTKLILPNNPKCFAGAPDASRAFIENLAHCPNLEELSLMHSGLAGDASLGEALSSVLARLPRLRRLWLMQNPGLKESAKEKIRAAVEARGGLKDFKI